MIPTKISALQNISDILSSYCSESMIKQKGCYDILNESSKIRVYNCELNNEDSISFNFINSEISFEKCKISGIVHENILTLNSLCDVLSCNHLDRLSNKLYNNIIQSGSIFNYPNPVKATQINSLLYNQSNKNQLFQLMNIPSSYDINNKLLFLQNYYETADAEGQYACKDKYGDGMGVISSNYYDLHFSSNYIANERFPYWSTIYKGFFTKDSSITLSDGLNLKSFLKTIPRNLNGCTLTINDSSITSSVVKNILIKDFYCGKIIFNIKKMYFKNTNIHDNDCWIVFNNKEESAFLPKNTTINDNKNILFNNFEYISSNLQYALFNFVGDNNYLKITNSKTLNLIPMERIFENKSYGNNILLSPGIICKSEQNYKEFLQNTTTLNGNMIFDSNSNILYDKKDIFSNHGHDFSSRNEYYNNSFRIGDVRPKIYQDSCAIGTIIGWVSGSNTPIPHGFYKCDGSTVYINNLNPKDEYYNAQLAYLLMENTNSNTFTLPDIKSQTINGNELIYIIKYNNNFEH